MVREALTRERLDAMPADMVAATFVARRAEGLMDGEQALLADWLAADPAHGRALALAERSWGAFDDAEGDEILAAMRDHARGQRRKGPRWPPLAAIAAMLLAVAATGLWLAMPRAGGLQAPQLAWIRYDAAAGPVRTIRLADGSEMTLGAGSVAEARFTGDGRAIRLLRGRALFEVSHDAARPFGVTASDRRVVALGTRFDVDLGGDALTVTLLRGKVSVEPVGREAEVVTLTPRRQFVERAGVVSVGTVAMPDAPDWTRELVDFDDLPLGKAIAEINRSSHEQIVIRDVGVAALRISGQFRASDAGRFAETVAELHGLGVVRHGGEIELVRK